VTAERTGGGSTARRNWLLLGALVLMLAYGAFTVVLLANRPAGPSTGSAGAIIYAVGDIAGENDGDSAVAAMLSRHNFDALLTLGDHAYENGSAEEFLELYEPTFGAFDARVRPAPGNHDYATEGAEGYFSYFSERSPTFSGAPYYAFALGGWRIYSLNSEIGEGQPGSGMYEWLRTDLVRNPADCVLAYWHKPILTVGRKDNDEGGMALIWSMLAANGGDVVLTGHDHNYQRWDPIDGMTSFVVGTGGRSRYPIGRADDRLAFADDDHYGALEMGLGPEGASYTFRAADDQVLDTGEISCSSAVASASPPAAPTALRAERSADGAEHLTWVAPDDTAGIIGYVVTRGNDLIGFTEGTSFEDAELAEGASVLYTVRSVSASGARSPDSPPVHSGGAGIGYSGAIWSPLDQNPASPSRDKPQSKIWFADGSWWGLLYTDGTADEVGPGYYIHHFDAEAQAWTNTAARADERDRSHGDVLWDEASQRLYVVSAIDSGAIKLYRFDYADGEYLLDSGFPVRLSEDGAESATIAIDSTDTLWVTVTQAADGSGLCVAEKECVVRTMHSTSEDYRWTEPVDLPVEGSTVAVDDISAVVSFAGRIAVAWSNQNDGSFRVATHVDGSPDTTWRVETLVVAPRGADDHLNLKSDEAGRVYLVVKTSLDDPAGAPTGAPLVTVWVRDTDGTWRGSTAWTVDDDVTRPQIVIDPTLGKVAVIAAAPGDGGAIYAKTADIASLEFEPGLGSPLMSGVLLNNPSTSKQPVDLTDGALVLAGDAATHLYWHNTVIVSP